MNISWTYKPFSLLTIEELYAILRLRSEVFVVEQNCPYLDPDDKDQQAYHLFGTEDETIIAYARILPPGVAFEETSIGRVLTHPLHRRNGTGKALMELAIEKAGSQFNTSILKIGAQLYLRRFYTDLGFDVTGEEYIEDGIPHIHMIRIK